VVHKGHWCYRLDDMRYLCVGNIGVLVLSNAAFPVFTCIRLKPGKYIQYCLLVWAIAVFGCYAGVFGLVWALAVSES
jgi:hypothetical protein